ncbi:MAG: efflux transporter periplasmic adaptor subunit, partial [Cyclobacteriaceae bacterium]
YIGALGQSPVSAELEFVSPEAKSEDGAVTFEIRARIVNKNDQYIRAGYSANAHVILSRKENTLAVKESLLQFDENETPYLEVLGENGDFKKKPVEIGLSDGVNIQVDGLKQNDVIKTQTKYN